MAGTLFTVAVVEASLALGPSRRMPSGEDPFYRPDPCIGWKLIPFKERGRTEIGTLRLDQAANSEGFRDREYAVAKERHAYRIAILGDSFSDQLGMPVPLLFHEILERRLNHLTDRSVEVLNFGIAGFSTAQQYLTFRCYAAKYTPDLVVLALYVENDILDNSLELSHFYGRDITSRPFFRLRDGRLERIVQAQGRNPLKRLASMAMPRTYGLLVKARGQFRASALHWRRTTDGRTTRSRGIRIDPRYGLYLEPAPAIWSKAWTVTGALIRLLASETKRHGASFLVVVIPSEVEFRPDRWQQAVAVDPEPHTLRFDPRKPERILVRIFKEHRINYLLLRPAFAEFSRRRGENLHFHLPNDNHWTSRGHALAASVILRKLLRDGLP